MVNPSQNSPAYEVRSLRNRSSMSQQTLRNVDLVQLKHTPAITGTGM